MKSMQPSLLTFSIFQAIGLFTPGVTITQSGIIHTERQSCPICGKLGQYNGNSNKGSHLLNNSLDAFLRKGQQYCRKCDKTFQVANKWLDEKINLLKDYITSQVLSLAYSLSEDEIVNHLERTNGIKLCKGTVHNIITKSEEELSTLEFEYEIVDGFYCYDEQYLTINGKRAYRIVFYDAKNDKVIYEEIHYRFSKKILQEILKEVFGDNVPNGFVVDMKLEYPSAFRAVFGRKIKIQFCVFHLHKLILKEYTNSLRVGKKVNWTITHYYNLYMIYNVFYNRTFELKILKSFMRHHENFVKNLTKKKVKVWVEKYKVKLKKYEKQKAKIIVICQNKILKAFRKILHDKKNLRRRQGKTLIVRSKNSAEEEFNKIFKQKNMFPKKIEERIEKIKKNFEYFVASEGEILTNNKLEGFFGSTLKKFRKKLKRTMRGFSSMLKRKRLEQNGKLCFRTFSIFEVAEILSTVLFFC